MLRRHYVIIQQGETSRTIELIDSEEARGESASGRWNHRRIDRSFEAEPGSEDAILFTSASHVHRRWKWSQADARTLTIGTVFDSASHKTGEEGQLFTALIFLKGMDRKADGTFAGTFSANEKGGRGNGKGQLVNGVDPYFKKGEVTWSVVEYLAGL